MSIKTDLAAITPTTTARQAFKNSGTDLDVLIAEINNHAADLQRLLNQVVTYHPTSGGDTTNHAAFASLLAELA